VCCTRNFILTALLLPVLQVSERQRGERVEGSVQIEGEVPSSRDSGLLDWGS